MESITSVKNPRVTLWKSLKDKKGRRETGCFLVEGRKSVEEACSSGFAIESLLVQREEDASAQFPTVLVPEHVMSAICDTKTPQGIAAIVRMREQHVTGRLLVALDGVQDPGNVGTILRTADAAGFEGVLLSDACADPYSPKVLRATMGSVFHLPAEITPTLPERLEALKQEGYAIISSELDGEPFYHHAPLPDKLVLVIGSEGNGVTDTVRKLATHRLKLPMRGRAESLNAAVAAGIMMYELTKDEPIPEV